MRYLIWSDLHSHNYREFSVLENGVNSRLQDCIEVADKVLLSAKENKVDGIIFLGDIYHLKNNLDNKVIQLTMSSMRKMASAFPLLLLPGHHDLYMWTSNPVMMELISEFSDDSVTLIEEPCFVEFHGTRFYTLPCTRKLKELNEKIDALDTDSNSFVFLGHQDVIGEQYGGFTVEHGLDADILSKKFRFSFLGHCHASGKIRDNVISIGAPLQHNFGDKEEDRGWWIFDTESAGLDYIKNDFSPRFWSLQIEENIESSKEKLSIPGNPDRDFYRIKVIGSHIPEGLNCIKYRRVSFDTKVDIKKRTSISFSDKKEDVIKKYVELRGGELDHKKLIDIGRRYL